MSFVAAYSKESKEDVTAYLKTRRAYLDPNGRIAFSTNVDVLANVISFITGP